MFELWFCLEGRSVEPGTSTVTACLSRLCPGARRGTVVLELFEAGVAIQIPAPGPPVSRPPSTTLFLAPTQLR